ncbi:hypothetical protein [Chromobacterium subtsugae]|uniref:hypothetical protein n=1 Tax=Chromobacterium subtsugae TaxID=251747 RepID=UPI0006414F43|nr:hypothetical protein [Chromobacterium subtsugae]
MTSRSRESLKRFFREGSMPSENHFADLIDSMLNMSDEGFRKTVQHGFEVYAPQGHDALLSFFRDQDPEVPVWRAELGGTHDALQLRGRPRVSGEALGGVLEEPSLLCLTQDRRVGIGTDAPQTELDVVGVLRSAGRRGAYERKLALPIWADGQWQDLTDQLEGCQAFEVMAGAGHRGHGRFGLLHAIAVNTYNPTLGWLDWFNRKRGIRYTHGYYSRRCDKLQLRWLGSSGRAASYRLQIRTGCDFGKNVRIQAELTQLWFDPHMSAGQP